MKRFLIWMLLAVVFQTGIYIYLDQVMLTPAASFSQQTVAEDTAKTPDPSALYSYNNDYYALTDRKEVNIYNSKDHKLAKKLTLKLKENISCFSWLPDRNLALVGINEEKSGGTTVTLKSISPETNSKPVSPQIVGLARGTKIDSIAYSTETNVIYILVKNKYDAVIYRTDANNNLKEVHVYTSRINRIASLKSRDILLYDNIDKGKVYAVDGKGKRVGISPLQNRYALIGVDQGDNVYIGRLNDRKLVAAVLVGKVDRAFKEYRELDFPCPVDTIKVRYDGKLLYKEFP